MPITKKSSPKPAPKRAGPSATHTRVRTGKLSTAREPLNILYFGEGGGGKTTDLAHMANSGRVLYVNAESGIKRAPLIDLGVAIDNIELYPDPDDPNAKIDFPTLENIYWQIKDDLTEDPNAWAGTVWDSASEITVQLLGIITEERAAKAVKLLKSGKTVSEMMANRFWTDQSEYGEMAGQVRSLIRRFRDLPCHFGASALMRRDVDEDTKKVSYGPAVIPSLQKDFVGWFDVVCRTEAEDIGGEDVWMGYFRKLGKYQGKDRYGRIPRSLPSPTFTRLLDYIEGRLTVASDAQVVAVANLREGVELKVRKRVNANKARRPIRRSVKA